MKKIFEKMRIKLIHKLGGYVGSKPVDEYFDIRTYQKKWATMTVGYTGKGPLDDEMRNWIGRELAHKLADKLFEEDLILFFEYPVDFVGGGMYRLDATITVEDIRMPKAKEDNAEDLDEG